MTTWALWAAAGQCALCIAALVFAIGWKDKEPSDRIISVIGIALNVFIIVGLWPLLFGGAA